MATDIHNKLDEGHMEKVGQRLQQLQDAASRRRGKRVANREIARKLKIAPATWGDWLKADDELAERQHYIDVAELFTETYGIPTKWQWIRDGDSAIDSEPLDYELVYQIILLSRERCQEKKTYLDESAQAYLISLMYPKALSRGEVSLAELNTHVDALARHK